MSEDYDMWVSRGQKWCIVILVDQSDAMKNTGAFGRPHCDIIAECVNGFVRDLAIRCTGGAGVYDWFDLAIIGYRSDPKTGMPILRFYRDKSQGESPLQSISVFAERPAKTTTVVQELFDEESGETMTVDCEMPCWIDPLAQDGPGLHAALDYAERILSSWIQSHEECLPPLVWHLTGCGSATDETDIDRMASLTRLRTQKGNVLLANTYLTAEDVQRRSWFLDSELRTSDTCLRALAQVSSPVPHPWRIYLEHDGFELSKSEQARLTFMNTSPMIINCINFGGRL